LKAAEDRQLALLDRAGASKSPAAVQQLTLAADQFLVRRFIGSQTGEESSKPPRRGDTNGSMGRSVIAGYHWFNDWGRDTMISLPGLALATGRGPAHPGVSEVAAALAGRLPCFELLMPGRPGPWLTEVLAPEEAIA